MTGAALPLTAVALVVVAGGVIIVAAVASRHLDPGGRERAWEAEAGGVAAALVAWTHHLPLRDPDGANLPTWFRLPVIVASAVALDVLARWALLVRRRGVEARATLREVVRECEGRLTGGGRAHGRSLENGSQKDG